MLLECDIREIRVASLQALKALKFMSEAVAGIIDSCGRDAATWLSNTTDSLTSLEPLANSRHSNEPIRFTGHDKEPIASLCQTCRQKA